jgi:starch synthase (maltosyl-transferring)
MASARKSTGTRTHPKPRIYPKHGQARVVITAVRPEVDGGRFPAKRIVGDEVTVEADLFADGHDQLAAVVRHRHEGDTEWTEAPMTLDVNDRWLAHFELDRIGVHRYTVDAWVDRFRTWSHDMRVKVAADVDDSSDRQVGIDLCEQAATRAKGKWRTRVKELTERLRHAEQGIEVVAILDDNATTDVTSSPAFRMAPITRYRRELAFVVERERAGFSAWYELFPRSTGVDGHPGTLLDCAARLPYVAGMNFDVVYLPPIHPIGMTKRKGPNNAVVARPGEPGSPWAIGGAAGGHKAVHPELGTLGDLQTLREAAEDLGLELALDIAFQCSPDHPYVTEHPEWFRHRPDGTVQYAENPPKKYEDIYPFDFDTEAWQSLWTELLDVFLFWIGQGIRIFRVDNPHTKSLEFWEWAIAEMRRDHPDVILLSEAFTRPKVMYELAKRGFSQSYTYFTWRTARWELVEYFTELTQGPPKEFFRPNAWPNTPDILPEHLQLGGRPAFIARAVLAATLSANYGVYGPAFELLEHVPRTSGSEEYLDSEKYQVRSWALDDPLSIAPILATVNSIRRENAALHTDHTLRFHDAAQDDLLCYSKTSRDRDNVIVVVVNLDPYEAHEGLLYLDLPGLDVDRYEMHDLLSGERYEWRGRHNYVRLDPLQFPAHVFRLALSGDR